MGLYGVISEIILLLGSITFLLSIIKKRYRLLTAIILFLILGTSVALFLNRNTTMWKYEEKDVIHPKVKILKSVENGDCNYDLINDNLVKIEWLNQQEVSSKVKLTVIFCLQLVLSIITLFAFFLIITKKSVNISLKS